tara:strand:+ start:3018 stop:3926 length:909 start_codon:yes stop_codon:yes gene_type:complete
MPYLGNQPSSGGYHKLDNLTASATDTYALTLGGSAYYPATANQLMVSLNGVIQAPQDSFTISGSNIVFASALSASDSIDFIMSFGDVYGIGTPADGTITDAKIQSMAASKLTGALPAIDGSALTGITSGGLIHLSTQTLASDASEVAFNSLIDTSTYTNYKVVVQGHITGDGNHARAVFRDSSDADITGSNYYRGRVTRSASVGNSTYMQVTQSVGGVGPPEIGFALDLNLNLINQAANTSIMPSLFGTHHYVQTNENNAVDNPMWMMRPDYVTTDVAGIRFYPSSGNFKAGSKFVLYALAE